MKPDVTYQYSANFVKDFKKDGQKLTADFQYSTGEEVIQLPELTKAF
jgi:hypothetical protein